MPTHSNTNDQGAYTASSQCRQRGQVMALRRCSICSVSSLAAFCIQYTEVPHAKNWQHAKVESSLSLMQLKYYFNASYCPWMFNFTQIKIWIKLDLQHRIGAAKNIKAFCCRAVLTICCDRASVSKWLILLFIACVLTTWKPLDTFRKWMTLYSAACSPRCAHMDFHMMPL